MCYCKLFLFSGLANRNGLSYQLITYITTFKFFHTHEIKKCVVNKTYCKIRVTEGCGISTGWGKDKLFKKGNRTIGYPFGKKWN